MVNLPTWPVILSTGLIDSINPCAIGVLVILISTLLELYEDKKKMLKLGLIYIFVVFITYLLAGFGLLVFLQRLNFGPWLNWIIGIIVIILGLVEIKDFFAYGKGFSLQISKKHSRKIMELMHNLTIPGSIVLGFFVAAVELPCTGITYLAITTVLAKIGFSWQVFWMLFVYNVLFVLPLIVILAIVYFGVNYTNVKKWKDAQKKWMRLFTGIVMILLGILMILWQQGIISIGI